MFRAATFFTVIGVLNYSQATPIRNSDLEKCQQNYETWIGNLVASRGTLAASTLWRILFAQLDLNGNQKVSAAEIVVNLESENIVWQNSTRDAFAVAQSWINLAVRRPETELNQHSFKNLIASTIGRMNGPQTTGTIYMCRYIAIKIPGIAKMLEDLSKCTADLAAAQDNLISSAKENKERFLVNVWDSAFRSIDENGDDVINADEIAARYGEFDRNSNWTDEGDATSTLRSTFTDDHARFARKDLYAQARRLMSGDELLENLTREEQLKGHDVMCQVLYGVISEVKGLFEANVDCEREFQEELNRTLDNDATFASGFVFAIYDADKDGVVTEAEMKTVVGGSSNSDDDFGLASIGTSDGVGWNFERFSRLLPGNVVSTKTGAKDAALELSKLSVAQQKAWKGFCESAVAALALFPAFAATISPRVDVQRSIHAVMEAIDVAQHLPAADSDDLRRLAEKIERRLEAIATTTAPYTDRVDGSNATDVAMPAASTSAATSTQTSTSGRFSDDVATTSSDNASRTWRSDDASPVADDVTTGSQSATTASSFEDELADLGGVATSNDVTVESATVPASDVTTASELEEELAGLVRGLMEESDRRSTSPRETEELRSAQKELDLGNDADVENELEDLFKREKKKTGGGDGSQLSQEEQELAELLGVSNVS